MSLSPGIHRISAQEYHALRDMLSAGVANTITDYSPAHAHYEAEHPKHDDTKQSDRGSVAHALLFEGIDRMAVLDYPDWRTNAAKEARDNARTAGKYPVLTKDTSPIHAMVKAAYKAWRECPDLTGYEPENGEGELSLIWSQNGALCRCRPDWYSNDRKLMIDAKFTELSANPESCARQIVSQGHDLRAAFYSLGGKAVSAGIKPVYVYLLQEANPPYCASFVACDPAMIALGEAKADYALGKWQECRRTGNWPGYDQRIHYASPPAWALEQWGVQA